MIAVLVTDAAGFSVAGPFASLEEAVGFVQLHAERLAELGVSASWAPAQMIPPEIGQEELQRLLQERRGQELQRLRQASGDAPVQGEVVLGG